MDSWEEVRIGDEIELAYGKSLPVHKREPGRFRVFGSNGCLGNHSAGLVLGPGIIVGRKGSVGSVVWSERDFWPIDTTYYVVNKKDHNWRFLFHMLSSMGLNNMNSHSAVPGLNREDVYSIQVLLPGKDEQKSIASVLDTTENASMGERSAIEKTMVLKGAMMQSLFTCGLRGETQKETEIGSLPESWEISPLGELCERTNAVDPRREGDRIIEYVDVSAVSREFLTIEATTRWTLREAPGRARKRILEGDVIFATVRPTLLRAAYVPAALNDQVCSTAFCVLRGNSERVIDKFLYYLVQRAQFIRQLAGIEHGASYPAVTDRIVKEQLVPVPSLEDQRQIVAILDAIDRKIDLHRKKRAVLDDLFKALLHKLMTGEIRVRDLDPSAIGGAGDFGTRGS